MGCAPSKPVDLVGEVNLYHFELHRVAGKGAFGKVRVVEHKRSKKLYALKYIDKQQCIKQKAVANIIQERRLLEEVDHPFLVNLRYAFQDDNNCFFVLDLMLGGDLRYHINTKGNFPENVVRFWTAELASGLVYLHSKGIMHRDIKPDNILLDEKGHAALTDFNIAIHYSRSRMHTSVAGSMAYMAPEVVDPQRRGYSWQVDWWSLGVSAFELLWHKRPFDGNSAEKMRDSIINHPIKKPSHRHGAVSSECTSAIWGLLERDPIRRLGCRTGTSSMDEFHSHSWFTSINWEKLEAKQLDPPFVPSQDRANFDVSYELDEFIMAEKPLTHHKRKANPEKMKPEMRQLEDDFTVYDFERTTRRSYYPLNQPITAAHSHTVNTDPILALPSQTNTYVQTSTFGGHSRSSSPLEQQAGQARVSSSSRRYSSSR
ncbi:kinase-like domain-containing protein [Lactarius akahatsu]|uniref:Kinase-like domain-containing protein n=1 Tax=Lactarius akahatsu TaxID=416441 RepID=A0AAD4Q3F7_9AGAM|nr:kinase-like domain-containing protein [Lactarius akahatsu]